MTDAEKNLDEMYDLIVDRKLSRDRFKERFAQLVTDELSETRALIENKAMYESELKRTQRPQ